MSLLDSALNDIIAIMDADVASLSITIEENRLTALEHKTPLSLGRFFDGGDWAFDQPANIMSITTGQVRSMAGAYALPAKPDDVVLVTKSGGGTDVLTLEFRVQNIAVASNFPVLPDLSVLSQNSTFRSTDVIDLSTLSFPAAEGVLMRLDVATPGTGGNILHELTKVSWVY